MNEQLKVKKLDQIYNRIFLEEYFSDDKFAAFANKISGTKASATGWFFPVTLKPRFVTKNQIAIVRQAIESIMSSLVKIYDALRAGNPEVRQCMGLTDEEMEILKLPCLYKHPFPFARFDSTLVNDYYKAIEINLNFPGGGGVLDGLTKNYAKLASIRKLNQIVPIDSEGWLDPKLYETFLECYKEAKIGPEKFPNIIVLTRPDFDHQDSRDLVSYLIKKGHHTKLADACDLKYDGKAIYVQDFRANLLWKWFDFHPHRDSIRNYPAIIQATREGKAIMVNSLAAAVMAAKTSFAVMTDARFRSLFTKNEWEACQKYVPWTRLFGNFDAEVENKKTNLVIYALKNQDKVVLKPVNGTCGKEVYVGVAYKRSEWPKIVREVSGQKRKYILQERVEILQDYFPLFNGKELIFQKRRVDILPYIFNGKFHLSFSRCAPGYILNMYQGAVICLNYIFDPNKIPKKIF